MLRAALLLNIAARSAAVSCCACLNYPSCSSFSGANGGGPNDCSMAQAFPSMFPYGSVCANGVLDNILPTQCQQGVTNPCNGDGWANTPPSPPPPPPPGSPPPISPSPQPIATWPALTGNWSEGDKWSGSTPDVAFGGVVVQASSHLHVDRSHYSHANLMTLEGDARVTVSRHLCLGAGCDVHSPPPSPCRNVKP